MGSVKKKIGKLDIYPVQFGLINTLDPYKGASVMKDPKERQEFLQHYGNGGYESSEAYVATGVLNKKFTIFLFSQKDRMTPRIAAHEAFHMTQFTMNYIGEELEGDYAANESWAYLLDFYFDVIMKFYKL